MSKHGKMELDDILSTLNKLGGAEGARKLRSGELKLVPRDPQADLLRPLGEPVALPAVTRFVAKDSFTRANGIAWMGDNFQKYILPLPEANVPEATIQVSELIRDARDPRIYTALDVDERGEVALAHFFRAIQDRIAGVRTDGWANGAYVIGTDGETWAVYAGLNSDGWDVDAFRLGYRGGWSAGSRFLSR